MFLWENWPQACARRPVEVKIANGEWGWVCTRWWHLCVSGLAGVLSSPAASCCMFVSARTSHQITNAVHYSRVGVRAGVPQWKWFSPPERHHGRDTALLSLCSMCLPRHISSATVFCRGGAFPLVSYCFLLVSLLPCLLCFCLFLSVPWTRPSASAVFDKLIKPLSIFTSLMESREIRFKHSWIRFQTASKGFWNLCLIHKAF